jgi:septal ring factor EnvC (AmiA/AmiB activator)
VRSGAGRSLAVLAAWLALAAGGGVVPAQPARREGVQAQREALDATRRQLEEAQARASAARRRERSLLADLEQADRTMARQRATLQRLDGRLQQLEGELRGLEGRRGRVAEETLVQRAAALARLRLLDRLARAPRAPLPLPGEDAGRWARDRADLAAVVRADLARLATFDATAERLGARQAAVDRARRELVQVRGEAEAERAALDAEAARRRGLLATAREDRAAQERLAAELAQAATRLEALVRDLDRRARARARVAATRPAAPGRPAPPAVGLGALRGRLPWPLEGRVLSGFGRQVHPRFGTEVVRHGIAIEAAEGAPVRAVHAGTALYRGWLRGYGNLLVLDHGQGYYTLYAHVASILVEEGERVDGGQVVARAGETGSVEGPRLYFEIRYQGRAEDPEGWLRRRS